MQLKKKQWSAYKTLWAVCKKKNIGRDRKHHEVVERGFKTVKTSTKQLNSVAIDKKIIMCQNILV